LLFDYLTLTFLEGPEEERVEHFSVATHFPKVQLEDMAQTVEAAVSWCPFWCGGGLLDKWLGVAGNYTAGLHPSHICIGVMLLFLWLTSVCLFV
jgi:hypothetical protein